MRESNAPLRRAVFPTVIGVASLSAPPVCAQEETPQYENLRVLPPDISRNALGRVMLDNLRGLGLRRLAGEGCLFCHVGGMDTPRDQWDYASDDKATKRKARAMMAMVEAINGEHLAGLEDRIDSTLAVTCYTCHAGRTDPRPLSSVLWSAYEAGGIDSAESRYRRLRSRYYGGDAYDFRVGVLPGIAVRMADAGAIDDAIAMAALNVEMFPGVAVAERAWAQLRLERDIDARGVEVALLAFGDIESDISSGIVSPALFDGLAWRLFRSNRRPAAVALMEANYARFPERYIPNESMAFIRRDSGDLAGALEILERWLEQHPNHERARNLLINMRGG